MYPHNTGIYSFFPWAHHRSWVHDLADAGYHCVNIGKMHIAPKHAMQGFHERFVVENPASKFVFHGMEDDEWGQYLAENGRERPLDRHKTDPDGYKKYQHGRTSAQ